MGPTQLGAGFTSRLLTVEVRGLSPGERLAGST